MGRIFSGNVPAYVSAYNALYSDIMNNVYLENDQLPSETALAEKYGISRNTLRQALAILCEDGLVIKSQGKGTIIAKREAALYSGKITNPMTSMCIAPIDDVELQYNFGPPTDIGRTKLGLGKSEIVLASTNVYKSGPLAVGYSFIQIPAGSFESLNVDSSDEASLEELVEKRIFEAAAKSHMSVKLITANEAESETLQIPQGEPLLLLEMILYSNLHQAFARCKFYIIPEHYKLQFQL
ncbi:MAG: GntR family transcriptional regulator [Pseudoflavonifractor sp.]